MPEDFDICRVCLATDVPMTSITGTNLQLVYERITHIFLHNSLPAAVCYVCCARLKRSHELLEMASKAALLLTDLLVSKKMTKSTVLQTKQDANLCGTLAISPTRYIDIEIDYSVPTVNIPIHRENSIFIDVPIDNATDVNRSVVDVFATDSIENANEDVNPSIVDVFATDTIDNATDDVKPSIVDVFATDTIDNATDDVKPSIVDVFATDTIDNAIDNVIPVVDDFATDTIDNATEDVKPSVPDMYAIEIEAFVPVDKTATDKVVEEEKGPEWVNVKMEIKEEPMEFHENLLLPDMSFKGDDEGDRIDDDNDDDENVPLKSLVKQEPGSWMASEEIDGTPAQSKPVKKVSHGSSRKIARKPTYTGEITRTGGDLVCIYCQRQFKLAADLKKHLIEHTKDRPHECKICKSRFKIAAILRRHLKTHTDPTYTCDVCQRRFTHYCSLTRHKRLHTGEKPYECHVCKKSFYEVSALKRHVFTHTGESPYKCNTCGLGFSNATTLKNHVSAQHTGDRYICDICHWGFVSKERLVKHLRVHDVKRYACKVCDRSFRRRYWLNRHTAKSHIGEGLCIL